MLYAAPCRGPDFPFASAPAGKCGCQGPQMRWRVRRGVLIATQKAAKEMHPTFRAFRALRALEQLLIASLANVMCA